MGTLSEAKRFEHSLVMKAGADLMHQLQKVAKVESTLMADPTKEIFAGSVVSMDDNGDFVQGLSLTNPTVAHFAIASSNDYDINSETGNSSGGYLAAYPCLAPYELETTEFDTTKTYVPGEALYVDMETFKLTNVVPVNAAMGYVTGNKYKQVGVVSNSVDGGYQKKAVNLVPTRKDEYNIEKLAFVPVYALTAVTI